MGMVATTFKLMPSGVDVDFDKLRADIHEAVDVKDMKEEAIAFGLKALLVLVVVDEKKGGIDDIENKLKSMENVQSVDVVGTTLL